MKYKVGDNVRIVANIHNHGFQIGDVVVIYKIEAANMSMKGYMASSETQKDWWIYDDEIEALMQFPPVPTQIGLSVLKSKEDYLLETVKQLEYQLSDYDDQYKKARTVSEDYETKLNEG